MSKAISISGVTYNLPTAGDSNWANNLNSVLVALAAKSAGKCILTFGSLANSSTPTTTQYLRPGMGTAAATEAFIILPCPGTISQLRVFSGGVSVGGAETYTVRRNGVSQSLSATVTAGASTGVDTDVAHAFVCPSSLYRISIQVLTGSGVTTGAVRVTASVMFQPS
jgi:hypothetical protein